MKSGWRAPVTPGDRPLLDPVKRAASLVATDSRSFVSNVAVADKIDAALPLFEIKRLNYTDSSGVPKRLLVAHNRPMGGGLALSGHMDPGAAIGRQDDPWSGRIAGGRLHGLDSTVRDANFHCRNRTINVQRLSESARPRAVISPVVYVTDLYCHRHHRCSAEHESRDLV